MEESFEAFRTYLPKYLSPRAQDDLFKELDQFPDNIDKWMYTRRLADERALFQGDGLAAVAVINLPDPRIGSARVMVISNTCDTAAENKRLRGPRLLYCPIIRYSAYAASVSQQAGSRLKEHLDGIRKQRTTNMFYLPSNPSLGEDCIALLDQINNCDLQKLPFDELVSTRLFTLSDYGFYIFLFKLSIHLTRLREGVART